MTYRREATKTQLADRSKHFQKKILKVMCRTGKKYFWGREAEINNRSGSTDLGTSWGL